MTEKKTGLHDLLKEHHTFPEAFSFKFIGKAEDDFPARVIAAVRDALGSAEDPPHSVKPSGQGNHVSVTVVPIVDSAAQVVAVYEHVGRVRGLLVSL